MYEHIPPFLFTMFSCFFFLRNENEKCAQLTANQIKIAAGTNGHWFRLTNTIQEPFTDSNRPLATVWSTSLVILIAGNAQKYTATINGWLIVDRPLGLLAL